MNKKELVRFGLAITLLGLLLSCSSVATTAPVAAPVSVHALRVEVPARIKAGVPLTVLVYVTPITATSSILLTAQGTFGLIPQQQRPVAGVATFPFMLLYTQFAGTVQLRASADRVEAIGEVQIVPGPAVDPMLPLVGPRSIVTGGKHWTLVVTTPRDALDNPVVENTLVTYRVQHPVPPEQTQETGLEIIESHTQNLLAWTRVYSHNRAGQMLIAANADFGHSPERVVMETPGLPVAFRLTADKLQAPADGRQLVRIGSDQIIDRFGNVLWDGTHVTLLAAMPPHEQRSLPATTIDGRIYTTLQAPSQPGVMTLQAWIAGVPSQPLDIQFTLGPAVQPILVTTKKVAEGIMVMAGPLVGQLGQFIPDGAAVTFTITAPDGRVETVLSPADYGYAQVLLRQPTLIVGTYQVTAVAGTGHGAVTFVMPAAAE